MVIKMSALGTSWSRYRQTAGGNLIGCGRITRDDYIKRASWADFRGAVTSCRVNDGYCNSRKIRSGVPRVIRPEPDFTR